MAVQDARRALERAIREARRTRESEEWYLEHIRKTYGERVLALFPDKPELVQTLVEYERGLIEALNLVKDLEES